MASESAATSTGKAELSVDQHSVEKNDDATPAASNVSKTEQTALEVCFGDPVLET
jgi:hypothetical protein